MDNDQADKLLKQIWRLRISMTDFQQAIEILTDFKSTDGNIQRRALLTTAVIAYARPFSKNETSPDARATAKITWNVKKLLDSSAEDQRQNYAANKEN